MRRRKLTFMFHELNCFCLMSTIIISAAVVVNEHFDCELILVFMARYQLQWNLPSLTHVSSVGH
jgi:hypothetical protein